MSPMVWDQSFSVGHPLIDDQHREFLNIMNTMECLSCTGADLYNQSLRLTILKGLLELTEKHFRLENRLMHEYGYADAYQHWRGHKNFDMSIYAIYREIQAGKTISDLSIYLTLRDKFRKHILKEDKHLFQSFFSQRPQRNFQVPELSPAISGAILNPIFQS